MADNGGGIANGSSAVIRKRGGDDICEMYVKIFTGKTIYLEVQRSDTINDVKVKIRAKEGIPVDQQALIFDEMVLDDTNTIKDFDIHDNSTFKLMHRSRGLMQILVKIPKRMTTLSLGVKPSETIGNVKAIIWDKEGIPTEEQELIFNEMVLEDSGTLVDFDIKRDSTLKVMFKSRGMMKIFVKILSNETGTREISLMVKPTDTISNVKDKIKFQEDIPHDEQVLIFNEMVLEDNATLADFQIKLESTLTLMRKSGGFMKIYVKTLTGKIMTLEVKPLYTIDNLKAMICEKEGIPSCQQRLDFIGKRFREDHDSLTLADLEINEGSTLLLHLSMKGS